jgi:hypothetical protein
MRHVVCVVLLVPILALAAGTPTPGTVVAPGVSPRVVNVLPNDGGAGPTGPQLAPGHGRPAHFTIGAVDTVGGTTYDWGANGPALRMLAQTAGKGIHVLWMFSADMSSDTYPDRNIRYNFYDYSTRAWNWADPDFMQAGVNVFAERSGYGMIDTDTNGVAVIFAHDTTGASSVDYAPVVARDADVGAGIFEYSYGENSTLDHYEWPWGAVGMNGTYHMAMIDASSQDNLYYSRCTAWPAWDNAAGVPSSAPEPLFPSHNIVTSKLPGSNKVCITWSVTPPSGYMQEPAYYRESQDGGDNWEAPVDLGYPPAYGADTVPSFHLSSLFPFYDRQDRLHIVGNVGPYVNDTNWILPGQIWHWCASNPDNWDLIHIAAPESLNANVGYNAMICDRPSLGEDENGNLFVAWEEFDGVNVEQTTSRLRADIWCSSSTDNGVTWDTAVRITDGGDVTYRFPSILNPIADTVMVEYMIDQVAGFALYAEGPASANPIVVQKWWNPYSGVAESPKAVRPAGMEIAVSPSPARGRTAVSYALPRAGDVSLVVYDATGRPIRTLAAGRRAAGRYTATWNAHDAAAGIYFCKLESDGNSITRKVVLSE